MPLLVARLLPTILQLLLGFMSAANQLKAPGADKKAIVVQAITNAVPEVISALPEDEQASVREGVDLAERATAFAVNAIDGLHAAAKSSNLYPAIQEHLEQASGVAGGVKAIVDQIAKSGVDPYPAMNSASISE